MQIKLICVGKLKEKYLRDAFTEYEKRLSRYTTLQVMECKDLACPEDASPAEEAQVLSQEGEQILKQIRDGDYVIALTIPGKGYDSVDFSNHLADTLTKAGGSVVFIIGGSRGLSDAVLQRADEEMSFSKLTFPHQLMRILWAEQVYRAFRIQRGEPYHK